MNQLFPNHRGHDIIIKIKGHTVGGQQNCSLQRSMNTINVTNKINGQWKESIPGTKQWMVKCSGLVIKDSKSFDELEFAFNNNQLIDVILSNNNISYTGKAYITDFPLAANFNTGFSYNITLTGVGELK